MASFSSTAGDDARRANHYRGGNGGRSDRPNDWDDMDLWDWIVWFFWIYIFFAYLMVLFSIIADIFRDSTLNGWLKAVWVFFLIFVPIVTALIYLIARGRSMEQRGMERMASMQRAQDQYIRETAGTTSAADEIAKARSLLETGAITQAEFDALKAKTLAI
jgi:hypothetical protein